MEKDVKILNPRRTVIEDLKIRNIGNEKAIAGEYYGNEFSYEQTFKMFDDYKKAFISLDGINDNPITISAPSTISSVNAFYGAIGANKIANMTGPGFLFEYTEKYTKKVNSKTVFILDKFLNEEYIKRLHKAGVKNVIITSITDYMHPIVKESLPSEDFLDNYKKSIGNLPMDMQFIRLSEFAKTGSEIKENIIFPYEENKIASYFLTGATTSQYPKGVQIGVDGLTKMSQIYDNMWFDFSSGDKNTIFIPIFYATGAIHGVHAGLFRGATNSYKPVYDRFAFARDLIDSNAKIAVVAPSHLTTLENANLEDGALKHVKYIFIGGEAITPSQMLRFRKIAKRLGIKYIINGYGMTETGSMSGMSSLDPLSDDDVTIKPVPGVKYRIIDVKTGEVLSDNERGILEVLTPCATAGYLDKEKNKKLFTEDSWVHTGDVAVRNNGRYRVFGRYTDKFTNGGIDYPMYDIEEKVLDHPGVLEGEVIKFKIGNEEYPAIVVVLKEEWKNRTNQVLEELSNLSVPGMEYLIGTKFIDNFKTNPITGKRDYLSLPEDKDNYYRYDFETKKTYRIDDVEDELDITFIENDIPIEKLEEKKLVLKK